MCAFRRAHYLLEPQSWYRQHGAHVCGGTGRVQCTSLTATAVLVHLTFESSIARALKNNKIIRPMH